MKGQVAGADWGRSWPGPSFPSTVSLETLHWGPGRYLRTRKANFPYDGKTGAEESSFHFSFNPWVLVSIRVPTSQFPGALGAFGVISSLGCRSADGVLAWLAESPGFDPHHHKHPVWQYMLVNPALGGPDSHK